MAASCAIGVELEGGSGGKRGRVEHVGDGEREGQSGELGGETGGDVDGLGGGHGSEAGGGGEGGGGERGGVGKRDSRWELDEYVSPCEYGVVESESKDITSESIGDK